MIWIINNCASTQDCGAYGINVWQFDLETLLGPMGDYLLTTIVMTALMSTRSGEVMTPSM